MSDTKYVKPPIATDSASHWDICLTFPIRDCIREVDENTWIIGGKILLSRSPAASSPPPRPPGGAGGGGGVSWSDGEGGFFAVADAPQQPPPRSDPLPSGRFAKAYDAGDEHVVFLIGEAVLKANVLPWELPHVTKEHATINWLRGKEKKEEPPPLLSFSVPEVLHSDEVDGRYYLFLSKVPRQTLDKAWAGMSEEKKQGCVDRIVAICTELALWWGTSISGVDGSPLQERYLFSSGGGHDQEALMWSSAEIGMDCSALAFTHCDLGPGNIFVDGDHDVSAIIDWELAGFFPREWIRTKFRISGGLDLTEVRTPEEGREWRRRVAQRLGDAGFADAAERWVAWSQGQ